MRTLLLLVLSVVAVLALAVPAVAYEDPVPWGEEVVLVPGACVTDPCPFPVTTTLPESPLPDAPL